MSYRTGFFAVSIALCAAIALLVMREREAPVQQGPSSAPTPSVPSASASASTTGDDAGACSMQLAACRAESWSVVAKAVAANLEVRSATRARTSADDDGGDPAIDTGPAGQRRVRCDIAEQQAREHWNKHASEILASIKDVGKESWIKAERKKDLDKLAGTLGLNAAERRRFDEGYDVLWAKHGPTIQAQIAAAPPDLHALTKSVLAFWHDEDQLVERILGGHARDDYRASELRSRTAIISILATLANEPFDDSIVW